MTPSYGSSPGSGTGASAHAAPAAVLIDLPHTPGRAALRAALMAMRVAPQTLPGEAARRRQVLATLATQPHAVAFIRDRTWRLTTYPHCFVGSEAVQLIVAAWRCTREEAVDLLCKRHHIEREAWLTMHRLMQFGLFEHVVRERGFIDGEFFYRFAGSAAAAER